MKNKVAGTPIIAKSDEEYRLWQEATLDSEFHTFDKQIEFEVRKMEQSSKMRIPNDDDTRCYC